MVMINTTTNFPTKDRRYSEGNLTKSNYGILYKPRGCILWLTTVMFLRDSLPAQREIYQCLSIQQTVAKAMTYAPSNAVCHPVIRLEFVRFRRSHNNMLHVPPCQPRTETEMTIKTLHSNLQDVMSVFSGKTLEEEVGNVYGKVRLFGSHPLPDLGFSSIALQ